MSKENSNNRKKKSGFKPGVLLIIVVVLLAAVIAGLFFTRKEEEEEDLRAVLAEPQIEESITVGATGDMLIHTPIITAVDTGYGYDFSGCFDLVAPYYQEPDLMIANLEVTCGGEEAGSYRGYPTFNCPDSLIPTLKEAGVDICLTANNHSYDTGFDGMLRTLELLDENGIEHLGTRSDEDEHFIMVKKVGDIKLGMVCFTYDTRDSTSWDKSLNGIVMDEGAVNLVNSFCYPELDELYDNVEKAMDEMNMLGVDSKIVFSHWGNEYTDEPNDYEYEIAQEICELGADVIIGGHPHVIQKYDTLTSSNGHQTLCLYSMGNELSNQRAELMDEDGNRGYTEDGLIFEVTYSKFNNGNVKITGLEILPTWVEKYDGAYTIVPCDAEKDPSSWGAAYTEAAMNSYERTQGRVSEAYNEFRKSKKQDPVPESLY
ncbi:MAG: CapA family protein [Lachnospiraceae bacterium]|nr:CapA family protein [Lachnospiraceae bacterium]